ncbi:hypothetical protein J6590_053955 [Homalodisca vitripennis]|nr:hypothetical protein J6590_053955 [Homalodisca vitripennis]
MCRIKLCSILESTYSLEVLTPLYVHGDISRPAVNSLCNLAPVYYPSLEKKCASQRTFSLSFKDIGKLKESYASQRIRNAVSLGLIHPDTRSKLQSCYRAFLETLSPFVLYSRRSCRPDRAILMTGRAREAARRGGGARSPAFIAAIISVIKSQLWNTTHANWSCH